MSKTLGKVSGADIKKAIETRDGRFLAGLYADDAVVRVIDHNNPPSRARIIKGRNAIGAFWDDICGRTMTHKVDVTLAEGNKLAFTQDCTYPDGAKVFCIAVIDLEDGRIARQTFVQAWDE
jgi:ketosteroid isomerase-like protein